MAKESPVSTLISRHHYYYYYYYYCTTTMVNRNGYCYFSGI